MARPLKIENAFWRLLEKKPYEKITIPMVAREAGITVQNFHKRCETMDELARCAFEDTAGSEAVRKQLSDLLARVLVSHGIISPLKLKKAGAHIKRISLYAGSGSPLLKDMATALITDICFSALSIDQGSLSSEERQQTEQVFSDLTALLGSDAVKNNPLALAKLRDEDSVKRAVKALKKLKKKYNAK